MEAVLITVYLIIVIAMIVVILLQRSEGGGLGMGTAGSNGLMTVRGSANLLTRTTGILAALFMATAIGLTIISDLDRGTESILQRAADGVGEGADAPTTVLDALNALQPDDDAGLAVPPVAAPDADPGLAVPAVEAPASEAQPAADAGLAVPSTSAGEETLEQGDPAPDGTPAAPNN